MPSLGGGRLKAVERMQCTQLSLICYPFSCVQSEVGVHGVRNDDAGVERRVWELRFSLLEERSRLHDLLLETGDFIISTE